MKTNIVSVKYEDRYMPKTFSGKAYSYFTAIPLEVGDLVVAPTSNGKKIARVSVIDIPEFQVEFMQASLKLITEKVDKQKYLKEDKIISQEAA